MKYPLLTKGQAPLHFIFIIIILLMSHSCSKSENIAAVNVAAKNAAVEEAVEKKSDGGDAYVQLTHKESEQKVDILIDGKFFTSYLYGNPILKKPVLFPVMSASGKTVTRGFPLATRPGERIDHTHHYGIWFNHGDVDGIDLWNSGRTPPKEGVRYGIIRHKSIVQIQSGDRGRLVVDKEWFNDKNELLIEEQTQYVFRGDKYRRIVTHTTTITAPNKDILFKDSKEGVFAMRVAREMEVASEKAAVLTGQNLEPMSEAIVDSTGVSGHYRNSEGLEGYPEVWGKRARWMQLSGSIENDPISICMFDFPDNVNHPPHWMARDYGLYGANGLGSAIYTEGAEVLNHVLKKSDSRTFKNEIVITDSVAIDASQIENWYSEFIERI